MQGFGVRRETRKKARRSAVSACFAGAEPIVRAIPSSVALTPGWAAFCFIADTHRRWRSAADGSAKAWPPTRRGPPGRRRPSRAKPIGQRVCHSTVSPGGSSAMVPLVTIRSRDHVTCPAGVVNN